MAIEINRTSSASAVRVLEAIAVEGKEWRESLVPDELREAGILQVRTEVKRHTFKFHLVRRSQPGPHGDPLELTGVVEAQSDGRSVIRGSCGKRGNLQVVLALIGLAGIAAAIFAPEDLVVVAVLGFGALVFVYVNDHSVDRQGNAQARYLVERLEHALSAAEGASKPPAQAI